MYSTVMDVRYALTPGGDPSDRSTAASLPDSSIEDAIREADATIDAYLGLRYSVPVETVLQGDPPLEQEVAVQPVRYWSRNIAAYLATLTWRKGTDLTADDPVRLRHDNTMQLLTAVRDGKATVDLPDADDTAPGEITVINSYEGKLFTAEDFGLRPVGRAGRTGGVW